MYTCTDIRLAVNGIMEINVVRNGSSIIFLVKLSLFLLCIFDLLYLMQEVVVEMIIITGRGASINTILATPKMMDSTVHVALDASLTPASSQAK